MATESHSWWDSLGCLVWASLAIWGVVSFCDAIWHSTFRYAIQYNVPSASVTVLKKPHDCDFLHAPIGEKNCFYEPVVSTVRTSVSTTGSAIVSFDGGQHWVLNDGSPPIKPSITVSWKKTDED